MPLMGMNVEISCKGCAASGEFELREETMSKVLLAPYAATRSNGMLETARCTTARPKGPRVARR
jgi:hypothetical protein